MSLIHVRLPESVEEAIEHIFEGENRTEKIKNFICSNIIGREMLLLEKQRCEAKLQYIEKALKENPYYGKERFTSEEKAFFEETLAILQKNKQFKDNPVFFSARRKLYNEKFAKSITTKEFELVLYQFKEE